MYLSLGQLGRAEIELRLSEEIARELDAAHTLSSVRGGYAHIAVERDDFGAAQEHVREALQLAEPTGYMESTIKAHLASTEVEMAVGDFAHARRMAAQARDLARWSHMPYLEVRATLALARAAWRAGDRAEAARELAELPSRAAERGFRSLAAQAHDLMGQIMAGAGDLEHAAEEFRAAAEAMKEILEPLGEEDRRSLTHHPDWREAIGNLLDTLTQLGRREEALGYMIPLGVATCEVEPGRAGATREQEVGA
jgi:ATP/maltotriose-dependent transcriptional regulator MalT